MLETVLPLERPVSKTPDNGEPSSSLADRVTLDAVGRTIVNSWTSEHLTQVAESSNKHFQLIIMPTEQCNFRCTYCYEDYEAGWMKPETISAIKRLLKRRVIDLETLTISWFGGEPLLAKRTVFDISTCAAELASQHPQLQLRGGMTTNGYFLDYETASALADCGVTEYQISLDGPSEVHDKTRLRADGQGTYERIWENLMAIRKSSLPVSVLLRVHFSADTVASLDRLIDDIKTQLLADSRFSVAFKAIGRWGGANDAATQVLSREKRDQVTALFAARLFGENPASPQNVSHLDGYVCYASRPNSLVIRANGDIGKCTVALYDERNKVGTLLPDGTIRLIPGRLAPWVRGLETLDTKTLSCPRSGMLTQRNPLHVLADGYGTNKNTAERGAVPAEVEVVAVNGKPTRPALQIAPTST
jgi:uncharacterized protein